MSDETFELTRPQLRQWAWVQSSKDLHVAVRLGLDGLNTNSVRYKIMHPLVKRTPAQYVGAWCSGTARVINDTTLGDGKSATVVQFDGTCRELCGFLKFGPLLGSIKVWPVVEDQVDGDSAPPQGWFNVIDHLQTPPDASALPVALAVLAETDDGYAVAGVTVLVSVDPTPLIEPNLPSFVQGLGPWAGGLPDDVETTPNEAQVLLGKHAVKLANDLGFGTLYVITAVPPGPLTHVLGFPAQVVGSPFPYGPRQLQVVVVAIDTSAGTP